MDPFEVDEMVAAHYRCGEPDLLELVDVPYPEEWMAHQDCPDYMFSTHGRMMSRRRTGKWTMSNAGRNNSQPYLLVACIGINGRRPLALHRMVAETFMGKSSLVVDHRDNDSWNNHIMNLEWVTSEENLRRGIEWNGGRGGPR